MSVGKKLNKKDLLSTNLATKHGYCTQLIAKRNTIISIMIKPIETQYVYKKQIGRGYVY